MNISKRFALTGVFVATLATGMPLSAQDIDLNNEESRYGYAVGVKIAEQLKQQFDQEGNGLDFNALVSGLQSGLTGENIQMSGEEADVEINNQRQKQQQAAIDSANQSVERGNNYRAEFGQQDGVQQTDSGLLYRVINQGDGDASPDESSTVVVHYQGTLIDGTVFDSSYQRGEPASFPLTGIIPGWKEILQLMKTGDKWEVVIPPELAYGQRGAGASIGPNETLVFEIELLEIK